jgi:hypothetical protein
LKGVVWERNNVSNLAASFEAVPHQSSLGSDQMKDAGQLTIQPTTPPLKQSNNYIHSDHLPSGYLT